MLMTVFLGPPLLIYLSETEQLTRGWGIMLT